MIKNLITYEEISSLARPCSTDRELAEAMIAEAQRMDVRPSLGDALYLKLADDDPDSNPEGAPSPDPYKTLLEGGRWAGSCGKARLLTGVKTTLAYYTLARLVRDGNIHPTTYGAVVKDGEYSVEAEQAERSRQYRELFAQADRYMAEAVEYVRANRQSFPEYDCQGKMTSNRTTFKIIGR